MPLLLLICCLLLQDGEGRHCGVNTRYDRERLLAEQNSLFIFDFLDNSQDVDRQYWTSVSEINSLSRSDKENVLYSLFIGNYIHLIQIFMIFILFQCLVMFLVMLEHLTGYRKCTEGQRQETKVF